jgi:hypothetical protein
MSEYIGEKVRGLVDLLQAALLGASLLMYYQPEVAKYWMVPVAVCVLLSVTEEQIFVRFFEVAMGLLVLVLVSIVPPDSWWIFGLIIAGILWNVVENLAEIVSLIKGILSRRGSG